MLSTCWKCYIIIKGPCTLSYTFFVCVIQALHTVRCVKTPLKMFTTDVENTENWTRSKFFCDAVKFLRQCVNVIDTTWGCIYFWMWKYRTKISDSVCKDLKVPLLWVMKGSYLGFGNQQQVDMHARSKKHFHCLIICIYLPYLLNDSQTIHSTIHFSKPVLCVTLICSDWSIGLIFMSSHL